MLCKGEGMKDAAFDDFIDRLRSDSDIVRVISDYVPLKKKGKNYWGCCPFHQERTPSFSVTPDKGFFYCFGCQTGGNVFNFLMKIENIDFLAAVKLLAEKMNIPLPEKEKTAQEREREKEAARLYRVNELARDFFHSCLVKTGYGKAARAYLLSRGISGETVNTFKLGFAPAAWDKLTLALRERGQEEGLLLKAGLAVERSGGDGVYDRFRNRVMFPINDARGRVVGFGGRVLDDGQPKYLNSPETAVFNKRHILYGFDLAYPSIRKQGQAVVVEGYMDAISAHAAGIDNVVASLGTAFTPDQARCIQRHAAEIVFAYDSDAAGQNATLRALTIVRKQGISVRVVSIPGDKDPDEFIRNNGADAFRALLASADALLDYQVKQAFRNIDYSGLEGKVAVVGKVVPALAEADNAVEVDAHIAHIAQTLAIDESAIRSEVHKFLLAAKKDKNVNVGKNITKLALSSQPAAAADQAERTIIRMMCEDNTLIPYIQAQIPLEEIRSAERRGIMKAIFNVYTIGKNIQDTAWAISLSEAANNELSHIMLIDIQCNHDVVNLIEDCIRAVHLANMKVLYEEHRLKADELERMGDSGYLQELAESQRIKHEISKLHYE